MEEKKDPKRALWEASYNLTRTAYSFVKSAFKDNEPKTRLERNLLRNANDWYKAYEAYQISMGFPVEDLLD